MKKILFSSLFILSVSMAYSQSTGELLQFSRNNYTLNTARSAAMAGAFTSLGADLASMSINPAGLAMYSRSEAAITPSLLINNNRTTANTGLKRNNSQTKFIVNNIAGVYATGQFAVGLSFNRIADFNGRYSVAGGAQNGSIGQVYMEQLAGVSYGSISTVGQAEYNAFYNYPPVMWNAIMAYQGELLNPVGNGSYYNMGGVFDYQNGDVVSPITSVVTSGAMNEFNISAAYNIKNLVYIGLTLGVPQLNYTQDYQYSEIACTNNTGSLDNFTTRQNLRMDGTGFNLKVGVTVRPVDWMRIGIAYHSPTWMKIYERSYNDFTLYHFNTPGYAFSDTPYLDNDYRVNTPSRLLAGVSFTIAKKIIVSADYERTWYNSMNYTSNINTKGLRMPNQFDIIDNYPNYVDNINQNGDVNLKNMVKSNYQATNNFRVGIEAQPANGFFIRAGYSYSQSPYSNDIIKNNDPKMLRDFGIESTKDLQKYGEINQYSAGLGYRSNVFGLDLTYVYGSYGQLPTKNYYYNAPTSDPNQVYNIQSEGVTKVQKELHQVMMTLIFKF